MGGFGREKNSRREKLKVGKKSTKLKKSSTPITTEEINVDLVFFPFLLVLFPTLFPYGEFFSLLISVVLLKNYD